MREIQRTADKENYARMDKWAERRNKWGELEKLRKEWKKEKKKSAKP